MKMSSFLFLSLALHAAALAYPALLPVSRRVDPVVVTVIDAAGENGGAAKGEDAGQEGKPALVARKAAPIKTQRQPLAEPERIVEQPKADSAPVSASDASVAVSAGQTEVPAVLETTLASSSGGGSSGNGNGRGRTGTVIGDGSGSKSGTLSFVTASYDRCPSPDYPEIARERLEGTVILRVLVDKEGKPKSLEVNKSSGFAVLDEAAVKHVKQRCRFHPARNGDQRVESLVEFPVEFKLAHLKR
jgi:periplasmic protein TonB